MIRNNQFYSFFKTIVQEIVDSNNKLIHEKFLNTVAKFVLNNINYKNIQSFLIIYLVLQEYALLMLNDENEFSEDVSKRIYEIMVYPSGNLLSKLDVLVDDDFINESEQYESFKQVILDTVNRIVREAIKHNNITFLESCCLLKNFFLENRKFTVGEYQKYRADWNLNYVYVLEEILSLENKIFSAKNYASSCTGAVFDDVVFFQGCLSEQKENPISIKIFELLQEFLVSCYSKLLEMKYSFNYNLFKVLYIPVMDTKTPLNQTRFYLEYYSEVLNNYYEYVSLNSESKNTVYKSWSAFTQLEYILKRHNQTALLQIFNDRKEDLSKKYSSLLDSCTPSYIKGEN